MGMAKVLVVGSTVVDLTFYSARIPLVGETVRGRFVQGLGGKGFNQAVSAALSGARTAFLSAVGEDVYAAPFADRLQKLGVEAAFEKIPQQSTGAATISVDETGRNSIIVALGANDHLSPRFLAQNEKMFDGADVLLLQFETNLDVIDTALQLARKRNPGGITILNPAPALPSIPNAILKNVDYLTPNETELATIAGMPAVRTNEELNEACERISAQGALLVTLGERGCFYHRRQPLVAETALLPAFAVDAIDTAGAGDAFNGAFAAGLLQNQGKWRDAAIFASAAAAISVTRPGTSAAMAHRHEVDQFLRAQETR